MHRPVMQNRANNEKKTITVAVYGRIIRKFIVLLNQNRLFEFKLRFQNVECPEVQLNCSLTKLSNG